MSKTYENKEPVCDKILCKDGEYRTLTEMVNYDGGFNINLNNKTTDRLSLYLGMNIGTVNSISGANKDSDTFTIVTDGAVPVPGNFICLQESGKITQDEIVLATPIPEVTNGFTIKVGVPLDYTYPATGACVIMNVDMNKDFSSEDGIFQVGPKGDYRWDITNMIVSMVLSTAGDDGLFGNLTALTVSQYFRKEDSAESQNLFSVKTNGDFGNECFELAYPSRSGGGGNFGMRSRISYNGPDKSGVAIRLDGLTDDNYRTVVRSDLRGLSKYRIKVQGHVVAD